MFDFLKPPTTEYSDEYDRMRFKLVWNLTITIILLLAMVSVINIKNDNYSSVFNLIEVGVGFIALYALWKTRKFRMVCIVISVCSLILISLAYFYITNAIHHTTPMWSMVNIIFTFVMLGVYWGLGVLIIHFIVLGFFYAFQLGTNLEQLPPFDNAAVINFIAETSVVGLAMGYLLIKFIRANQNAEEKVKENNMELMIQNKIITNQNKEKEMMLKEIHHRVKNNLQVITSLLRLQAQDLEEGHKDAFQEAVSRVKSMALIHEKMYKTEVLANFDLKNYLESLTNDLIDSYSIEKPIKLFVESGIDKIGTKSVVPLSLLFNELISNSIKHGFDERPEGKINVNVTKLNDGVRVRLEYSDNGRWKESKGKSFGLEVIDAMTEQMEGTFSIEKKDEGTYYTFELNTSDE